MKIEKVSRGSSTDFARPTLAIVVGYPNDDQVKIRFAGIIKEKQKPSTVRYNVVMTYAEAAEIALQLQDRIVMRAAR